MWIMDSSTLRTFTILYPSSPDTTEQMSPSRRLDGSFLISHHCANAFSTRRIFPKLAIPPNPKRDRRSPQPSQARFYPVTRCSPHSPRTIGGLQSRQGHLILG